MNIIHRKLRGTIKPNIEDKGEIFTGNIMHVVNTNNLSYCGLQERILKFSPCGAKAATELERIIFKWIC